MDKLLDKTGQVPRQLALSPDESRTEEHQPELTLRSALVLAASALAYFCTSGFMNAYGVFQQYYTAHYLQGLTNFEVSWLGSFAGFCMFAFAPIAGFLSDRLGPTTPICIGVLLELISIFMVSLCKEYYQFFLAQGLALGMGMSFICIPTSTMVPQYFKRNRGLAQGVSIGGSSLGGVLWPVALDQLLNRDQIGFGWSMRIIGFIMIPLLGLTIVGLGQSSASMANKTDGESSRPASEVGDKSLKRQKLAVLWNAPFVLLCAGLATASFGFFIPIFYIPTYAVHVHLSENLAFYLLSIFNGASLFGRILPGYAADRFGHFNILVIATSLSGIVAFTWTQATSVPGLVVWVVAYGFSSGALLSQQLACATLLSDDESRGAAIGIVMGSISLAALFGPPIGGALEKASGYVGLSCFSGSMLMAGALLMALARFSRDSELWSIV